MAAVSLAFSLAAQSGHRGRASDRNAASATILANRSLLCVAEGWSLSGIEDLFSGGKVFQAIQKRYTNGAMRTRPWRDAGDSTRGKMSLQVDVNVNL